MLLSAIRIDSLRPLSGEFLSKDSAFYLNDKPETIVFYEYPDGPYILLFFFSDKSGIFSAIRHYDGPVSLSQYAWNIGAVLDIGVSEIKK